jgi:spore germination protein KC
MKHKTIIMIIMCVTLLSSLIIGKNVETKRINRLGIVSALGIDLEDDLYVVTAQVVNPGSFQKHSSDQMGATVYSEKGATLYGSLEKINNTVSRSLFLDDTEVLLIQDKVLQQKGINEILDYLLQNPYVSSNIQLIIVKEHKTNTVLQTFVPVQKISSIRIREVLENNENNLGTAFKVVPSSVKNTLLSKENEITLPYLTISGPIEKGTSKENIGVYSPKSMIKINGMAYFQRDKLMGYLTNEESKMYSLLHNKLSKTHLVAACPSGNGSVALNVIDASTKIKLIKGKPVPTFEVKSSIEGEILESHCKEPYSYPNVEIFEKQFENTVTDRLEKLMSLSRQNNSDFIGFANTIAQKDIKTWKSLQDDWVNQYKNTKVTFKVDVKIPLTGDIQSRVLLKE